MPRPTTYVPDTSNWTRENLAWLAGLIEGEGNIRPAKNGNGGSWRRYRIILGMVDQDAVREAYRIAGMGYFYPNARTPSGEARGNQQMARWELNKKAHLYALLAALFSFFRSQRKREEALAAMNWSS